MLLDANLLLYAVDRTSPFHTTAKAWLSEQFNGSRRVGIPWQSLVAFVRISTHPRASANPLGPDEALGFVEDWLAEDTAWTPVPGRGHARIFTDLVITGHLTGNLVSDAHLAALAIEHGLTLCSNDSDFARFPGLNWTNRCGEPDSPQRRHRCRGGRIGARLERPTKFSHARILCTIAGPLRSTLESGTGSLRCDGDVGAPRTWSGDAAAHDGRGGSDDAQRT